MILKHRDKDLLRFDWIGDTRVRIVSVNDAERRFLPLEFGEERLTCEEDALRYPLEDWLASRSAPVGRHFMRNLMESLGLNINSPSYPRKSLEFSKGLSLNDVYWVVADDFRGTWVESNLYDNPFSEAMAEIAFTGHGRFDPRKVSTSPEMTTNGMLPYELTEDLLGRLATLETFRFEKHRHYDWADERRDVLSGFLQKRVSDIRRFGRNVDEKDEQSLNVEALISSENVGVRSSSESGLNALEQKAALLILRNSFITEEEIANQLDVTIRQAERIIAALKKKAGLTRRGSDKTGEWYFDVVT